MIRSTEGQGDESILDKAKQVILVPFKMSFWFGETETGQAADPQSAPSLTDQQSTTDPTTEEASTVVRITICILYINILFVMYPNFIYLCFH